MKTGPELLRRGRLFVFALAVIPLLNAGCERKEEAPSNGGGTPAPVERYEPPTADISVLAPAMQARVESLRQAVIESPRNADRVGTLGTVYLVQGFPKQAIACFKRAVALAPETVHWYYYLALSCERTEDFDAARKAYERAISLDPEYTAFRVRLARLLIEDAPDRAEKLCRQVLDQKPKDAAAVLTLGLVALKKGDTEKAIELANQALEISPGYPQAHLALARAYKQLHREDDAKRQMEAAHTGRTPVVDDRLLEALMRNGFSLDLLINDVQVLVNRGALPQAEKAMEVAIEADRTGKATLGALALLRTAQGRYDEAADAYRKALADHPDVIVLRTGLADVLARAGKDDEAEKEYAEALKRSPDDPRGLDAYSRFMRSRGRDADAEKLLRSAVERDGKSPALRFLLGALLVDLGEDAAAREQLETCLKLAPKHAAALWTLGVLSDRAGDQDAAREYWEATIKASPKFTQAYSSLARLALSKHDYAGAVKRLRAGLESSPAAAELANTLAWALATCPDDSVRNGDEAVKWAEGACQYTQNRLHGYVDTLAAAYAEKGRFDDAVRMAKKAIELAKAEGADTADYEARLKLFEAKKPFRDAQ